MSHPGHRNAYGGESLRLQIVKRSLRAFLIAPEGLAGNPVVHGVHLVAQVPAVAEFPGQGDGVIVRQ